MFDFLKKNASKRIEPIGAWGDGTAVLSAIDDGVVAIDPSGNLRIINLAAERMIGWTNGDATGLVFDSVLVLVDKDGRILDRSVNPIRRAISSFESFTSSDLFLKTQSGRVRQIFLQINPVDNMKTGLVVVFRDISREVKENREQAEFISTASHEMRTPVASIEGYLGLALNPATATIDNRARDYLQKAHESTRYLGQLFRDLLDISKAEDGRMKNEPVVLDAIAFTRDIWEGLKSKAEDKNLEYIFMPDQKNSSERTLAPVYFIYADRDHLREVLDNLFENAIKYTPSGRVVVNVSGDNENVRISVEDSGIGIPAEDIPHLFQKFYRVDNSETREIGGTGLGLYLSRKLVEGLGGKLYLESEYKKGSIFTVQLPRIDRNKAEKLKEEEERATTSNEIKQDNEKIQDYIKEAQTNIIQADPKEDTIPVDNPLDLVQLQYSPQEVNHQPNYKKPDTNTNPPVQFGAMSYSQERPTELPHNEPKLGINNENIKTSQPPTLSEIERMREEYVHKMLAERRK